MKTKIKMINRRLPDGVTWTRDEDLYIKEWESIIDRVEKVFVGYKVTSCNPGFTLELRETIEGDYFNRVLDTVKISITTLEVLEKVIKKERELK